uniref:C2H2-type domain-containing protein n=1 Tax=Parastrongyloides trichosuri TaxID=131310 RepID=A0A0N4Z517_PARTI
MDEYNNRRNILSRSFPNLSPINNVPEWDFYNTGHSPLRNDAHYMNESYDNNVSHEGGLEYNYANGSYSNLERQEKQHATSMMFQSTPSKPIRSMSTRNMSEMLNYNGINNETNYSVSNNNQQRNYESRMMSYQNSVNESRNESFMNPQMGKVSQDLLSNMVNLNIKRPQNVASLNQQMGMYGDGDRYHNHQQQNNNYFEEPTHNSGNVSAETYTNYGSRTNENAQSQNIPASFYSNQQASTMHSYNSNKSDIPRRMHNVRETSFTNGPQDSNFRRPQVYGNSLTSQQAINTSMNHIDKSTTNTLTNQPYYGMLNNSKISEHSMLQQRNINSEFINNHGIGNNYTSNNNISGMVEKHTQEVNRVHNQELMYNNHQMMGHERITVRQPTMNNMVNSQRTPPKLNENIQQVRENLTMISPTNHYSGNPSNNATIGHKNNNETYYQNVVQNSYQTTNNARTLTSDTLNNSLSAQKIFSDTDNSTMNNYNGILPINKLQNDSQHQTNNVNIGQNDQSSIKPKRKYTRRKKQNNITDNITQVNEADQSLACSYSRSTSKKRGRPPKKQTSKQLVSSVSPVDVFMHSNAKRTSSIGYNLDTSMNQEVPQIMHQQNDSSSVNFNRYPYERTQSVPARRYDVAGRLNINTQEYINNIRNQPIANVNDKHLSINRISPSNYEMVTPQKVWKDQQNNIPDSHFGYPEPNKEFSNIKKTNNFINNQQNQNMTSLHSNTANHTFINNDLALHQNNEFIPQYQNIDNTTTHQNTNYMPQNVTQNDFSTSFDSNNENHGNDNLKSSTFQETTVNMAMQYPTIAQHLQVQNNSNEYENVQNESFNSNDGNVSTKIFPPQNNSTTFQMNNEEFIRTYLDPTIFNPNMQNELFNEDFANIDVSNDSIVCHNSSSNSYENGNFTKTSQYINNSYSSNMHSSYTQQTNYEESNYTNNYSGTIQQTTGNTSYDNIETGKGYSFNQYQKGMANNTHGMDQKPNKTRYSKKQSTFSVSLVREESNEGASIHLYNTTESNEISISLNNRQYQNFNHNYPNNSFVNYPMDNNQSNHGYENKNLICYPGVAYEVDNSMNRGPTYSMDNIQNNSIPNHQTWNGYPKGVMMPNYNDTSPVSENTDSIIENTLHQLNEIELENLPNNNVSEVSEVYSEPPVNTAMTNESISDVGSVEHSNFFNNGPTYEEFDASNFFIPIDSTSPSIIEPRINSYQNDLHDDETHIGYNKKGAIIQQKNIGRSIQKAKDSEVPNSFRNNDLEKFQPFIGIRDGNNVAIAPSFNITNTASNVLNDNLSEKPIPSYITSLERNLPTIEKRNVLMRQPLENEIVRNNIAETLPVLPLEEQQRNNAYNNRSYFRKEPSHDPEDLLKDLVTVIDDSPIQSTEINETKKMDNQLPEESAIQQQEINTLSPFIEAHIPQIDSVPEISPIMPEDDEAYMFDALMSSLIPMEEQYMFTENNIDTNACFSKKPSNKKIGVTVNRPRLIKAKKNCKPPKITTKEVNYDILCLDDEDVEEPEIIIEDSKKLKASVVLKESSYTEKNVNCSFAASEKTSNARSRIIVEDSHFAVAKTKCQESKSAEVAFNCSLNVPEETFKESTNIVLKDSYVEEASVHVEASKLIEKDITSDLFVSQESLNKGTNVILKEPRTLKTSNHFKESKLNEERVDVCMSMPKEKLIQDIDVVLNDSHLLEITSTCKESSVTEEKTNSSFIAPQESLNKRTDIVLKEPRTFRTYNNFVESKLNEEEVHARLSNPEKNLIQNTGIVLNDSRVIKVGSIFNESSLIEEKTDCSITIFEECINKFANITLEDSHKIQAYATYKEPENNEDNVNLSFSNFEEKFNQCTKFTLNDAHTINAEALFQSSRLTEKNVTSVLNVPEDSVKVQSEIVIKDSNYINVKRNIAASIQIDETINCLFTKSNEIQQNIPEAKLKDSTVVSTEGNYQSSKTTEISSFHNFSFSPNYLNENALSILKDSQKEDIILSLKASEENETEMNYNLENPEEKLSKQSELILKDAHLIQVEETLKESQEEITNETSAFIKPEEKDQEEVIMKDSYSVEVQQTFEESKDVEAHAEFAFVKPEEHFETSLILKDSHVIRVEETFEAPKVTETVGEFIFKNQEELLQDQTEIIHTDSYSINVETNVNEALIVENDCDLIYSKEKEEGSTEICLRDMHGFSIKENCLSSVVNELNIDYNMRRENPIDENDEITIKDSCIAQMDTTIQQPTEINKEIDCKLISSVKSLEEKTLITLEDSHTLMTTETIKEPTNIEMEKTINLNLKEASSDVTIDVIEKKSETVCINASFSAPLLGLDNNLISEEVAPVNLPLNDNEEIIEEVPLLPVPEKRKRGRKPKNLTERTITLEAPKVIRKSKRLENVERVPINNKIKVIEATTSNTPKRRGRPPKNPKIINPLLNDTGTNKVSNPSLEVQSSSSENASGGGRSLEIKSNKRKLTYENIVSEPRKIANLEELKKFYEDLKATQLPEKAIIVISENNKLIKRKRGRPPKRKQSSQDFPGSQGKRMSDYAFDLDDELYVTVSLLKKDNVLSVPTSFKCEILENPYKLMNSTYESRAASIEYKLQQEIGVELLPPAELEKAEERVNTYDYDAEKEIINESSHISGENGLTPEENSFVSTDKKYIPGTMFRNKDFRLFDEWGRLNLMPKEYIYILKYEVEPVGDLSPEEKANIKNNLCNMIFISNSYITHPKLKITKEHIDVVIKETVTYKTDGRLFKDKRSYVYVGGDQVNLTNGRTVFEKPSVKRFAKNFVDVVDGKTPQEYVFPVKNYRHNRAGSGNSDIPKYTLKHKITYVPVVLILLNKPENEYNSYGFIDRIRENEVILESILFNRSINNKSKEGLVFNLFEKSNKNKVNNCIVNLPMFHSSNETFINGETLNDNDVNTESLKNETVNGFINKCNNILLEPRNGSVLYAFYKGNCIIDKNVKISKYINKEITNPIEKKKMKWSDIKKKREVKISINEYPGELVNFDEWNEIECKFFQKKEFWGEEYSFADDDVKYILQNIESKLLDKYFDCSDFMSDKNIKRSVITFEVDIDKDDFVKFNLEMKNMKNESFTQSLFNYAIYEIDMNICKNKESTQRFGNYAYNKNSDQHYIVHIGEDNTEHSPNKIIKLSEEKMASVFFTLEIIKDEENSILHYNGFFEICDIRSSNYTPLPSILVYCSYDENDKSIKHLKISENNLSLDRENNQSDIVGKKISQRIMSLSKISYTEKCFRQTIKLFFNDLKNMDKKIKKHIIQSLKTSQPIFICCASKCQNHSERKTTCNVYLGKCGFITSDVNNLEDHAKTYHSTKNGPISEWLMCKSADQKDFCCYFIKKFDSEATSVKKLYHICRLQKNASDKDLLNSMELYQLTLCIYKCMLSSCEEQFIPDGAKNYYFDTNLLEFNLWVCPLFGCGKTFNQKSRVDEHIKNHHYSCVFDIVKLLKVNHRGSLSHGVLTKALLEHFKCGEEFLEKENITRERLLIYNCADVCIHEKRIFKNKGIPVTDNKRLSLHEVNKICIEFFTNTLKSYDLYAYFTYAVELLAKGNRSLLELLHMALYDYIMMDEDELYGNDSEIYAQIVRALNQDDGNVKLKRIPNGGYLICADNKNCRKVPDLLRKVIESELIICPNYLERVENFFDDLVNNGTITKADPSKFKNTLPRFTIPKETTDMLSCLDFNNDGHIYKPTSDETCDSIKKHDMWMNMIKGEIKFSDFSYFKRIAYNISDPEVKVVMKYHLINCAFKLITNIKNPIDDIMHIQMPYISVQAITDKCQALQNNKTFVTMIFETMEKMEKISPLKGHCFEHLFTPLTMSNVRVEGNSLQRRTPLNIIMPSIFNGDPVEVLIPVRGYFSPSNDNLIRTSPKVTVINRLEEYFVSVNIVTPINNCGILVNTNASNDTGKKVIDINMPKEIGTWTLKLLKKKAVSSKQSNKRNGSSKIVVGRSSRRYISSAYIISRNSTPPINGTLDGQDVTKDQKFFYLKKTSRRYRVKKRVLTVKQIYGIDKRLRQYQTREQLIVPLKEKPRIIDLMPTLNEILWLQNPVKNFEDIPINIRQYIFTKVKINHVIINAEQCLKSSIKQFQKLLIARDDEKENKKGGRSISESNIIFNANDKYNDDVLYTESLTNDYELFFYSAVLMTKMKNLLKGELFYLRSSKKLILKLLDTENISVDVDLSKIGRLQCCCTYGYQTMLRVLYEDSESKGGNYYLRMPRILVLYNNKYYVLKNLDLANEIFTYIVYNRIGLKEMRVETYEYFKDDTSSTLQKVSTKLNKPKKRRIVGQMYGVSFIEDGNGIKRKIPPFPINLNKEK